LGRLNPQAMQRLFLRAKDRRLPMQTGGLHPAPDRRGTRGRHLLRDDRRQKRREPVGPAPQRQRPRSDHGAKARLERHQRPRALGQLRLRPRARRNVAVLVAAQAILGSQMPMIFVIGGLAGQMIAPSPAWPRCRSR
jgi:hypothetical protein